MKYMGSKNKISKHIVPIIQSIIDSEDIGTYIEPFVGGSNIIDKINCDKKIGYDKSKYLIELFKYLQKHDVSDFPLHITKEEYSKVRGNKDSYSDWYVGLVGFLSSWNGRFFDGGYSGIRTVANNKQRDYYQESVKNIFKQKENILDVHYETKDFSNLNNIKNSLIYCDAPYQLTKKYSISKDFDYELYWDKIRKWSKHNIVLVSEYDAPDDFKCIWEQEVNVTINHSSTVKKVEKLFILNKILKNNSTIQ